MISKRLSDDIPPKMKILNIVIIIPLLSAVLSRVGALQPVLSLTWSNEMWRN